MKFLKKAILINLAVIFMILVSLTLFFITPWGKSVAKTVLLTTETVPDFPIRPLKFFTKDPKIEEVTIITVDGKEIKADLYRPRDNKKHPAVVLTLGTIVTRKDVTVTRFAEALSRTGFAVLIPDLPDFLSGFVWTDSVDTLISSVEYLDQQNFVNRQKIGFAAFCVGASTSIIAAENERIADKVAFIAAVSPYFDLFTTVDAIKIRQAIGKNGKLESWEPAKLSMETFYKGFINYVQDEKERDILKGRFLESKEIPKDAVEAFSKDAKDIYEFLSEQDPTKLNEAWQKVPQGGKDLLIELSPSTKIDRLSAKLFVLVDKKDTFVPRIEGERLAKSLPKGQINFVEVDSFEHVNPATRLKRWATIKQLFNLGRYLYDVLSGAS